MMRHHEEEHALKRYLKRKVSYVTGLLVAYLITGHILPAATALPGQGASPRGPGGGGTGDDPAAEKTPEEIEGLREDLLVRILAQKEEIEALIAENEAKMRELRLTSEELLRKGDYYAKPIYPSQQIFFTAFYDAAGKMKNRTREALAHDLSLLEDYLALYYDPEMGGMTDELAADYAAGRISAPELAYKLLVTGKGIEAGGGAHGIEIEATTNVEAQELEIPTIARTVDVQVDAPGIPATSVPVINPSLPNVTVPTVSIPTVGTVTAPTISLNVVAPAAVPAVTVSSVNPTAPSALNLSAPSVSVSVNPPNIEPTFMQPLAAPDTPEVLAATVNPTGPGVFSTPTSPATVTTPTTPAAPTVSILTPPEINYAIGGFGQATDVAMNNASQGIIAKNYGALDTSGTTFEFTKTIDGMSGSDGYGTFVVNGGSLQLYDTSWIPYSGSYTGYYLNTFISDVLDHDVTIDGNYIMHANGYFGGTELTTKFAMFLSYNPYMVGDTDPADKTVDFRGTLTITGNGGLAMEHQLLAGHGGGTVDVPNVNDGTTTTIMKNSGTINLSGTNLIGMLVDTEYFYVNSNGYFKKRPQTINAGTIHITSGAVSCVAVDNGIYYVYNDASTGISGLWGPNTQLQLGTIVIDGTKSYGYRQKDYTGVASRSGDSGVEYYDQMTIDGSGGVITVKGSENVGISIAQGVSTYSSATIDPISNMTSLQIEVGGDENVGFLRNSTLTGYANTNDMILDSTKLGATFGFIAGATRGALIRSDINGVVLAKSLTLTAGSTQNTALQAGNTGSVELASGYSITSSLPTFYGLTAGNFGGSTGATATNHGTLNFSGANSIGIAIASGNTGVTDGNITVSGASATGVLNEGNTTISGGTITVSGNSGTGVYHATGATTAVSNTAIVANAAKANGVFNAGTGMTLSGGSIQVTGASGAGNLATGIYNTGTLNPNNVAITANNYGVGIYNAGTMSVTGGSLTVSGTNAIGLYQKSGSTTLTGPITASGANAAGVVYEAGTFSGVTSVTAAGNNSLGLYNKGTLTTTPAVSLTANNATGLYNETGAYLTATGNITATGTLTGLTGIYNLGTLTNSTATITLNQPSATGVYNDGNVTNITGSVTVSGTAGNISIGILNRPGKTITNITGTTTAGNHATAIYNAGTMTVTGPVTANGTAQSTGIYNTGAGNLTLNGAISVNVTGADGTGIFNDSSSNLALNAGTLTVSGSSSAALYHRGTGTFTFGGTGAINTTGASDAGIYNANGAGGHFVMNGGTISAVGVAPNGSVGIYNKGTIADFSLSGGTITASNDKATGLYNEGAFTMTGGTVTVTGLSATGLHNNGSGAVFTIGVGNTGGITVTGVKASTIYDKGGTLRFNGNSTLTAKDGATGVYVTGGNVTTGAGVVTTVNVDNTLTSPATGAGDGVGVFAINDGSTGSNVDMTGAKITVKKGAAAAASYGSGPGGATTNLNLTGATVDYDGEGFAVYSNGQYGKINMTNATLHLRGDSTGLAVDYSLGTPSITFNNTHIEVWSPGVTLVNMKDYATPLLVSSLSSGITAGIGAGVTVTDHTGGLYTLGRVDGGNLTIDTNIARTDTSGPGSDYYRRFHGQRLKTTVNGGVTAKAVLSTAQATADYDNQVIGIESNSSAYATSAAETKVTVLSGGAVEAARTDASGPGAVGIYSNYGGVDINSGGKVDVQQGYTSAGAGAGVYAVNGSAVTNSGAIKVAGQKSIGILAMGYRLDSGGSNTVGAEFGTGAAGQGTITVSNPGSITMDSAASIGIYAENNSGAASLPAGTPVWTAADDVVSNTGTIKVVSGNSATDMSVGMYGDQVTLKNSGTIEVGDYAVGIYGVNGSVIDAATGGNLGTIKIGGNSVAVMGSGSTLASGITSLTLQSDNTTQEKVGIMYVGTPSDIDFSIDGSAFNKGILIYLKNPGANFTWGSAGKTLKVGANGVGIYLDETASPGLPEVVNAGTIDLVSGSTKAVGMYAKEGTISNTGIINLRDDSRQIGMYAEGSWSYVNNPGGVINFLTDNGIGIYISDSATVADPGTLNFGTAKDSIGILMDGTYGGSSVMNFTSPNANRNICIYAQDKNGTPALVSMGTMTVDGVTLPASGGNKTIGVYLKRNSVQNSYSAGNLTAINGAIGLYSSGLNRMGTAQLEAQGNGSIAVYSTGGLEMAGIRILVNGAAAGETAIGVYATNGLIDPTSLILELGTGSDYGTGMVLAAGASLASGGLYIPDNSTVTNVGVYYIGGGNRVHGASISLNGQNTVGIYVDDGTSVTNPNGIFYNGSGLVGAYVGGGSTYDSSSTTDQIYTPNSAGIVAGKGSGINRGTLTVIDGTAVAMAALAPNAADTATVTNETGGLIDVTDGAGMLAGALSGYNGTSIAKNKGTIDVAAGAAGVAIVGSKGQFDGTGGTINVNGSAAVGIYLEEAQDSQITSLGNFTLGAADAIAVYANKSKVGSNLTLGASTTQGIALFASGTAANPTEISADVDVSASGAIGVYAADQYVKFTNSTIKSGYLGLYLGPMSAYTLENVTVEAKRSGAVGIYTQVTNLAYKSVTTVDSGGVGIYVPAGATLNTAGGTINVNGSNSVGIVLSGGTANIGTTGALTLNFGSAGGLGILVSNGGVLNIGSQLTVTGTGALAAVENSSMTNNSTITVTGSTALLGHFTTGGPYTLENGATGVLNVTGGGLGVAATGTAGAATVIAKNSGTINVSGKSASGSSSVGMYTTMAEIQNPGTINVGQDGVGIYATGTGQSVTSSSIVMSGTKPVGIVAEGNVPSVTSASISGGTEAVGLYLKNMTGTASAGAVSLGDDSVGVFADGGNVASLSGAITVGAKTNASPMGIYATNGGTVNVAAGTTINGGDGAIGVGADGATITGVDTSLITLGRDGVLLYATNGGSIGVTGNVNADGSIGLLINGSGAITGASSIDVRNGGVGAYFIGSTSTVPVINIYDGVAPSGGNPAKYSIGAYYRTSGMIALPTLNQIGSWTIGAVIEAGAPSVSIGNITLGTAGATNQIGVYSRGTAGTPIHMSPGTISVSGTANIGFYGEYTDVSPTSLSVGDSPAAADKSQASVGIYLKHGGATTGNVQVGKNSIGIYAENLNPSGLTAANIDVDDGGVGLYATGSGSETIAASGALQVGKNEAIGIYGKDTKINVSGNLSVDAGKSLGIVSEGAGDVNYTGTLTIADKGSDAGSIGIYKKGSAGVVTTSAANWTIGDGGYGIYAADGASGAVRIQNQADMTLGEGAVGIYGKGVTIENSGVLDVGPTYLGPSGDHTDVANHRNSVGIYATEGATVRNTGTINVDNDHSLGVYISNAVFENVAGGVINVDHSGIGVLAKNNARAVNSGTINIGSLRGASGNENIGMAAYDSVLENGATGVINVNNGTGLYVGQGATLKNDGVINILSAAGTGIAGSGAVLNEGIINLSGGGTATNLGTTGGPTAEGSVVIDGGGIQINGNYVAVGGVLHADKPVVLNGPYVDVTTFPNATTPLFNAPDVSGKIRLTPNFPTIGNGWSFKIENFTKSLLSAGATKIAVECSPMFLIREVGGALYVAKKPYEELMVPALADLGRESQWTNLYGGLDSVFYGDPTGNSRDSLMLKGMNSYLEEVYNTQGTRAFNTEAELLTAETRGDIYGNIQSRMQDAQHGFDRAFAELEQSYNTSKDSDKWSVIYGHGRFRDDTVAVEDYDYDTYGLMYMKEKEGRNYADKQGWYAGFAVTKFRFDDAPRVGSPSRENIYSLRAGLHRTKTLDADNTLRWKNKIELGYNFHDAKRTIELDKAYRNKGRYSSFQVKADTRLEKSVHRSLTGKIDLYAGLALEYGAIPKFREKGDGLHLDVKGANYFSVRPEVGISAMKRHMIGKKTSVKLEADLGYAHELGAFYGENKARIHNGDRGYYSLIRPEKESGMVKGRLGLTFEKANKSGVTFDVEVRRALNKKDADVRFGVRFKYVFGD